jgi:hypothetical protein
LHATDPDIPENPLQFEVFSSDLAVLPAAALQILGSDNERTLSIQIPDGVSGRVLITVSVTDGVAMDSTDFSVWIKPEPVALTIEPDGLDAVVISWEGPGILQTAEDISGPWADQATLSPARLQLSPGMPAFFRLINR